MSLVARHLENAGIATVVVGSAKDIVETVGVPRFVFVDYPLGNPMGRPFDVAEQNHVAVNALELLVAARVPRVTRRLDLEWGNDDWRANYMRVGPHNQAELATKGQLRRAKQADAKSR